MKIIKIMTLLFILANKMSHSFEIDRQIRFIGKYCNPPTALHSKKILISIIKNKTQLSKDTCPQNLSFLFNKCATKITCHNFFEQFNDVFFKDSSVLIGE